MRIDIDTFPAFSAISTGNIIGVADLSGAEYAAIGVIVTAIGGAPTRSSVTAVWADSFSATNLFINGDVFGTPDFTVTGKYMISRIGPNGAARTAFLAEGFLLPPPLKYVAIVGDQTAGGTLSGQIFIWKFVR